MADPIGHEKDAKERIKNAGMELAFIALHGRFAEDVIYMVEGKVVRHHPEELK